MTTQAGNDLQEFKRSLYNVMKGRFVSNSKAPLRWYGGKFNIVNELLELLPYKQGYCEPFAGSAVVFFSREPSPIDIINDRSSLLVNFYRVLQDKESFDKIFHKLNFTLWSRDEVRKALNMLNDLENYDKYDPVELAWAFLVSNNVAFMCFVRPYNEGQSIHRKLNRQKCTMNITNLRSKTIRMHDFHKRLMCTEIENMDAVQLIKNFDKRLGKEAVFYLDPPYVHETRTETDAYNHEMTNDQHVEFIDLLCDLKGSVVLSGYKHKIYDKLENYGFRVKSIDISFRHPAGAQRRQEVLWYKNVDEKVRKVSVI